LAAAFAERLPANSGWSHAQWVSCATVGTPESGSRAFCRRLRLQLRLRHRLLNSDQLRHALCAVGERLLLCTTEDRNGSSFTVQRPQSGTGFRSLPAGRGEADIRV